MLKVVYPGSFDPPTYGHLNIIERASGIYDEVEVVIAVNRKKDYTFSPEERCEMIADIISPFTNVTVTLWDKLIVDYAKQVSAKIILRGVRALGDFSYEFELAMLNKGLNSNIETIFMPTDPKFFVLRSASIKELTQFHGDISNMVPPIVEQALKKKLS